MTDRAEQGLPLLLSIRRAAIVCGAMAALLCGYAFLWSPNAFYGSSAGDVRDPALDLTTLDGRPFRLDSLKGHAVLVYFGYASCPEICSTTFLGLGHVLERLGSRKSEIETVFVTLDPVADTPDKLRQYLASFDPPPIGLTGSEVAVANAARNWNISWWRDKDSGLINHTSVVFLLDPRGRLRTRYSYSQLGDAEAVANDIRHVLD